MSDIQGWKNNGYDRTNVIMAAIVFVGSFIVYHLTVQHSIPFWDCGEFIACSVILGIPHPPGTPLFVLIGRIFSMIPLASDMSFRINYISVISSAVTATLSYLLTVKIVRHFLGNWENPLSRWIAYIGGVAGGFFVAFGETNWSNAIEAEVYGIALAMSVLMVWLAVRYFEVRGTAEATRIKVLFFFIALLGIGIHMTTFLVVPICSIFFILNDQATRRDFMYVCGYIVFELLLIVLLSNGRGGYYPFLAMSAIVGLILLAVLYRKINWTITMAIVAVCSVMIGFNDFLKVFPTVLVILIVIAVMSKSRGWRVQWKTALAIMVVAFIGFSVHLYLPIRSAQNPRIDENHPARSYQTFVDFLDRKQYGSESMVERMFHRRGTWENQFFRHPNMGYWSYFETQWSKPGWSFIVPFFALGVAGLVVASKRRPEIGLPFTTLIIICSVGLILYMNFADGTKYDFDTGDAYLEVRNRDYFFTPAFVFFGIAMGMGVSAVIGWLRDYLERRNPGTVRTAIYASSALVLLPAYALATNYHVNDRSRNFLAYEYAQNLLDSCKPNTILFTSGDNDTFPVWCLQEAYNYRKDVRVVNLSLLNTDWYVKQMKDHYNVPISLSDEQISWNRVEVQPGIFINQPAKRFNDRPRKRMAYLTPSMDNGRLVKVQDMMVDEVVLENNWRDPIFFSSPPYAESPLKLRDRASQVGMAYELQREPDSNLIALDRTYELYMKVYKFKGLESSKVYRDENATGVFLGLGFNATRTIDELNRRGRKDDAIALANHMIEVYPEYYQSYMALGDYYDAAGDSAKTTKLFEQLRDTLTSFYATNQENQAYKEDLGLITFYLGKRKNDQAMQDAGVSLMRAAYEMNPNNGYAFNKLVQVLYQQGRYGDMQSAAREFADYKVNQTNPLVQQILGMQPPRQIPGTEGQ